MSIRRSGGVALIAMSAFLITAPAVSADTHVVECGLFFDYTAPDPSGPTDGSITLGSLDPWTIAADATLSSAITTNLTNVINNQPTCLALDVDSADRITSIDFANQGTISGPVVYDSGNDLYVFAHRLPLPTSVATSEVGLDVLFVASADAGSTLAITFDLDPATGALTGFTGRTTICGVAQLLPAGKASIGGATIPAAALDAADADAIDAAGDDPVCAKTRVVGSIGGSGLALVITITISDAAGPTITPPPTSTISGSTTPASSDPTAPIALLAVFLGGLVVTSRHRRRAAG